MNRPFFIAVLSLALTLPIGACRRNDAEKANELAPPARLVVGDVSHDEDKEPISPAESEISKAEETTVPSLTEPQRAQERASLPYPDRTNIFQEPDVQLVSRPNLEDEAAELRLKGFVNVNGRQALVMWNGRIRAVSEGDQLGDVQVIEIAPPQIRFQRGRVRWVESLHTLGG